MNNKVEDLVVEQKVAVEKAEKLTCGIIMPIAGMGAEYSADHWVDVMKIIHSAVEKAGFIPRIVSDSEESTVIHGSIINNIYSDAIVVCDVSNKNANVMFELGMRLAFNKPVVIIKDDKTDYSFDTGNIQHENYRRDLRHNTVEKFINDLSKKIKKTHEASLKPDYQSFLSYFGKFEVAKIENKSIGGSEAIGKLLNKMNVIESQIKNINQIGLSDHSFRFMDDYDNTIKMQIGKGVSDEEISEVMGDISAKIPHIIEYNYNSDNGVFYIYISERITHAQRLRYLVEISKSIERNILPF